MKECRRCKEPKDLPNFYARPKNKGGLSHICKECINKACKEYWHENLANDPERVRQYYVNKKVKAYKLFKERFKANLA